MKAYPWMKAEDGRRQKRLLAAREVLDAAAAVSPSGTLERYYQRGSLERLAYAILSGESYQNDVREQLEELESKRLITEAAAKAVRTWLD